MPKSLLNSCDCMLFVFLQCIKGVSRMNWQVSKTRGFAQKNYPVGNAQFMSSLCFGLHNISINCSLQSSWTAFICAMWYKEERYSRLGIFKSQFHSSQLWKPRGFKPFFQGFLFPVGFGALEITCFILSPEIFSTVSSREVLKMKLILF